MDFKKENTIEKIGERIGYIFGYFLFTTVFFFILSLSAKLPKTWAYINIMGITLLITVIGIILKKTLK